VCLDLLPPIGGGLWALDEVARRLWILQQEGPQDEAELAALLQESLRGAWPALFRLARMEAVGALQDAELEELLHDLARGLGRQFRGWSGRGDFGALLHQQLIGLVQARAGSAPAAVVEQQAHRLQRATAALLMARSGDQALAGALLPWLLALPVGELVALGRSGSSEVEGAHRRAHVAWLRLLHMAEGREGARLLRTLRSSEPRP
jgi:hypothetical protein